MYIELDECGIHIRSLIALSSASSGTLEFAMYLFPVAPLVEGIYCGAHPII